MTNNDPAQRTEDESRLPLAGRRVLVVENDSDTLQMFKIILEQNGADVIPTDSVSAALTQFEAQQPDAILTDIGMPGLDGYALVADVRRRDAERRRHTNIVAVTGFSGPREQELATASGFDDYITKPFDPRTLVETLVRMSG
jgi:CheY-like chemotaxis protein